MSGRPPDKRPGTLAPAFKKTTLPAYTRTGRNPAAISALASIERRADAISTRMVEHHKKFEDRWVAKESIRIWKRQLEAQAKTQAPAGEDRQVSAEQIAKLASRNVTARTNRRLSKINDIKVRMTNALVRNLDRPAIRQSFNNAASDTPAQSRRIKL